MDGLKWSWWVGHTEERYHTECNSREEAVQIATEEYDGGYICEAVQGGNLTLSEFFHANRFLESADEMAWDEYGDPETPDPIFDVSPNQEKDLQERVRNVIDEWQKENGLQYKAWRFEHQRNEEYIPSPNAEAETA